MATGTTTLFWYVLCCVSVWFIISVAGGIVFYADWKKKRRLKAGRRKPSKPDEPA